MFAHGLSIAALFAISGQVRERTGTLTFAELGGLAKPMPVLGLAFGLAAFASIGLPGFGNFASEILVFFGAFSARDGGAVLEFPDRHRLCPLGRGHFRRLHAARLPRRLHGPARGTLGRPQGYRRSCAGRWRCSWACCCWPGFSRACSFTCSSPPSPAFSLTPNDRSRSFSKSPCCSSGSSCSCTSPSRRIATRTSSPAMGIAGLSLIFICSFFAPPRPRWRGR